MLLSVTSHPAYEKLPEGAPEQGSRHSALNPVSPPPRCGLIKLRPVFDFLNLPSVYNMGDPYPYPVFFECPSLDGEQRKKIQNYFNIRRKSGGGDCGSVTNIKDKVYSIAFKEREGEICDFKYLSADLGRRGLSRVVLVKVKVCLNKLISLCYLYFSKGHF